MTHNHFYESFAHHKTRTSTCVLRRFIMIAILSTILTSCAVGPDFVSPEPPKAQSYTEHPQPNQTINVDNEKNTAQNFRIGKDISGQWWTLFESPSLNKLIDRGLQNNQTLQAAQASLKQAEENLKAGMGVFYPSIDAQLAASRQKIITAPYPATSPSLLYNLYGSSVNVSYMFDIFGGNRRQVEALQAQVDHQRFELEAAYLTLTANIVTTSIKEASLRDQIEATKELVTAQEKTLSVIKSQFLLGGVSQADVLSQETLVAQTKSTLPPLESQLAQTRHALSILVGCFPSESNLPHLRLNELHLPTELPITLPSTIAQQRPDIKSSEALLHQASAQIGVAKANLFPQFTLTGSLGSQATSTNNLFASSSTVWSLASQLLQPIFRGGSLAAKENAAIAAHEQAFAQYKQTVLQAFQNIADVLHALVEDAKTLQAQREAENFARSSLEISQKQLKLGAINFVTLLTAEQQYQQVRISRIQAEAARYADTAALFQALGGGWWNREPYRP